MTASVTGCSTWIRQLTSRKKNSPVVGVDDELDRAEVAVADRAGEATAASSERVARARRQRRRRRLLDQLLVAALDRAVALAEVHHRAVLIGGDLDLDVAGATRRSAPGTRARRRTPRPPRCARAPSSAVELVRVARALDPAAAAAAGRLHQQRVADPPASCRCGDLAAGQHRQPGPAASSRARSLSPASSITSGGGPTNISPCSRARAASARALGEEAVSGMDRVAAGPERRLRRSCRRADSSQRGRAGADAHHAVGSPRRQPVAVRLGGAERRTRGRARGRRRRSAPRSRRGWR